MWPLAGGVLLLGGLLPNVALWLWGGAQLDATAPAAAAPATQLVWRAAAGYCAVDAVFALAALALLWIGVAYGNSRGIARRDKQQGTTTPAPYPGAWVEADGRQAVPQGFPSYLALAFVVTVIAPSAVLAGCLLSPSPSVSAATKALAAATLAPYLLVFAPQILLETRLLNRSFMTPVLPVLFAYYRFWQFVRALGLVRHVAAAPHWLLYYLLSLMAFWVFDTGCTLVWLPGMYEWQLQDVQLLTRLSQQRQQRQQQQQHKVEQPAKQAEPAVQHRWRLAGFDYSFGF